MDSLDVIKVCARRWYVFLPIVLLAAGAGFGLSRQLKSTYTAMGSYAFVYTHPDAVTPNAPDPRNANPLIANGNAALLGEAVQANLNGHHAGAVGGGEPRLRPGRVPDSDALQRHIATAVGGSYLVQTWADSPRPLRVSFRRFSRRRRRAPTTPRSAQAPRSCPATPRS